MVTLEQRLEGINRGNILRTFQIEPRDRETFSTEDSEQK